MTADKQPEPRRWLAAARERARLTQDGLGHKLGLTGRTVSNWERGIKTPGIDVRHALADALGFTYGELLRRFGLDAAPEPAEVTGNGASPFARLAQWLTMFVRAEQSAYAIWTLVAWALPAHCQTADYARAVELSGHRRFDPEEVERLVEMRMGRAAVLDTGAEYVAIIPAPLLDAVVGGYQVTADQFAHLLDRADRSNITLLVIEPQHLVAAPGEFIMLATAGPSPDTVAESGLKGTRSHEGPIDAADHAALFDHLRSLALDAGSSRAAITKAADRFAALAKNHTTEGTPA